MKVSAAVSADLADLTRLFAGYLRFYQVPRSDADVAAFLGARLQRGDSQLFIARDGRGRAQGFVQLYVDEGARRCGVGEALMNAARAHAEASGACGLQLETAKSNLAGQRLYERLGYVRDERFFTYWLSLRG
jgi:ribosomal protein S18 acetylase RimI-like enzyme